MIKNNITNIVFVQNLKFKLLLFLKGIFVFSIMFYFKTKKSVSLSLLRHAPDKYQHIHINNGSNNSINKKSNFPISHITFLRPDFGTPAAVPNKAASESGKML